MGMPARTVTLALVDPTGVPLGTLALPGTMPTPYWQEIHEVVDRARDAHGIDVTVLRLLSSVEPSGNGGPVTYVAEYDGPTPAAADPTTADPAWTAPHPLRMPWANPGGPAATLAWARRELGRTITGRSQRRTWHLSSIWRLDTDDGRAWVKEVPAWCAYEGAVLSWLHRPTTPVLLAHDGGRLLLADIPGTDRYEADIAERAPMLAELLDIQTVALDHLPELRTLGVRDRSAATFTALARELAGELPEMDELVADLPALFAAVAECGVPDTLVHGDFHPGNVRSDGTTMVIIDWGECVVAHPALDLLRMCTGLSDTRALEDMWCAHWRTVVPGCHPERTIDLLAPVAALHGALSYRTFTRLVEPDERPYHDADVLIAAHVAIKRHRANMDQLKIC